MEYVAVDLETTGLSPVKERIIEIGAVRFYNGKETDHFSVLVDPERELPQRIIELTGISEELLAQRAVSECDALKAFLEFAGDSVLLGHNLPFDYSFLKTSYSRVKKGGKIQLEGDYERMGIDTLAIAKKHLTDLPCRTLPFLCEHFSIDSGTSHRALDDARSAAQLYAKLCERFGEENAVPLVYRLKKTEPMTPAQKNYLNDLIKYHKIECKVSFETMTKSEASRMIDRIILEKGKPLGRSPRKRDGARQSN